MPKTSTKQVEFSLLEKRIEEFQLPRCPYQPAFDRIAVVVVPEDKAARDSFIKGGVIVKPKQTKDWETNTSARGVLVAAGLGALDVLRSHGMEVGHVVWVARLSPWRHVIERSEKTGGDVEMLFMRVGDIVGSEDTLKTVQAGELKITRNGKGQHVYEGM